MTCECCYQHVIGRIVRKRSGKPFKSGLICLKVSGVIPHPIVLGEYAFTFENDESYVACCMCEISIQDEIYAQLDDVIINSCRPKC